MSRIVMAFLFTGIVVVVVFLLRWSASAQLFSLNQFPRVPLKRLRVSSSSSSSIEKDSPTSTSHHHNPTKAELLAPKLPKWYDVIDVNNYTYQDYLSQIPTKLILSERDLTLRKEIFDRNFRHLHYHNTHQNASYTLGLNELMDLFDYEMPAPGYDKRHHPAWNRNPLDSTFHTASDAAPLVSNKHVMDFDKLLRESNLHHKPLPSSVDWRFDSQTGHSLATPVKAQGKCGSCWAFATTAALETHLALNLKSNMNHEPNSNHHISNNNENNNNKTNHRVLTELSVQELVSCVPNPSHCGGTGGCDGSTAELALGYITSHGILEEWEFGYSSYNTPQHHEAPIHCPLKLDNHKDNDNKKVSKYFHDAVATVQGYARLPTNNYTALMHAVAHFGPVIVNVAADDWKFYESGVYSPSGKSASHADINHVVVLMGYGTDKTTHEPYWLVRNSYGPFWGEDGYIRLKRVDPATLPRPDSDCAMDVKAADGIACTIAEDDDTTRKYHKHHHSHHITPPAVKVCGTSGILFDPILPLGARYIV